MYFVGKNGLLAQLVEQLTLNQRVEGSSPPQPIGCQTHETDKRWCESILKTFIASLFLFLRNISINIHKCLKLNGLISRIALNSCTTLR